MSAALNLEMTERSNCKMQAQQAAVAELHHCVSDLKYLAGLSTDPSVKSWLAYRVAVITRIIKDAEREV